MNRHRYGCAYAMTGKPCDCGADRATTPKEPGRSPVHGVSTAGATEAPETAPYHSKEHFQLALAWIEKNQPGGMQLVARALAATGHVT